MLCIFPCQLSTSLCLYDLKKVCLAHAKYMLQSWNKDSCFMTWSFAAQSAQFCNHTPSRNHGLPFFITSVHKSINFLLSSSLSVTAASEPLFLCCLNKQTNESLTLNALRPGQQPSFCFTHTDFFSVLSLLRR